MPPTGGFESLKYKRNLPYKGPGAYVLLGGVTAICAYGFYRLGKGNLERRYVVSSYCLRTGLLWGGQLNVARVIAYPAQRQTWPLDPAATPYQFYALGSNEKLS